MNDSSHESFHLSNFKHPHASLQKMKLDFLLQSFFAKFMSFGSINFITPPNVKSLNIHAEGK